LGKAPRRSAGHSARPTAAESEQAARAADRAGRHADLIAAERALTTVHEADFPRAARPVLAAPSPLSARAVRDARRELRRQALLGVSVLDRRARRAAATSADQAAPDLAHRRHLAALVRTGRAQADLDVAWAALLDHDPKTVIATVDDAFADNGSDSTCIDAGTLPGGQRYVTCVVLIGGLEMVPEHRGDLTPTGKPSIRRRTKTDRNTLYTRAMASTALATVKEALAVAPAADEVRILLARRAPLGVGPRLEPVYLARYPRTWLRGVDWRTVDPADVALTAPDVQFVTKGQAREVVALADVDGSLGRLLRELESA
jgi:hypothetical protein